MKSLAKSLKAILLFGVAIQIVLTVVYVIKPLYRDIATVQGASTWTRSAQLSFGDRFTDFMEFVRTNTQQDVIIVVPPTAIDPTFGNQGIMQFFLFPRSIVNCPSVEATQECLELFAGESTYFLSVGRFPEPRLLMNNRKYMPFDDYLGILFPPKP